MSAGELPHRFALPAAALRTLIDRTRFAISTEETRYYLNGIYLHATKSNDAPVVRAVATDGHRLARFEMTAPEGAAGMPGIIVPRKTVLELRKLVDEGDEEVQIALGETKIRVAVGAAELTSKLIDGTFPDYDRVIPAGNDKVLEVPCKEFAEAVDRVSTISTERSRAVKLAIERGSLTVSATSPENGIAVEELEARYQSAPLEIGFNSRYLLDITDQIGGEYVQLPDGRCRLPDDPVRRRPRGQWRQRALRADADARVTRSASEPALESARNCWKFGRFAPYREHACRGAGTRHQTARDRGFREASRTRRRHPACPDRFPQLPLGQARP